MVKENKENKESSTKTEKEKGKALGSVTNEKNNLLAVIRIRGNVHVKPAIAETLRLLNLNQNNHCIMVDDRPQYRGMIQKVKDYVTWGKIDAGIAATLILKRGRLTGNKHVTDEYIKKNTQYKSITDFVNACFSSKATLKDIPNIKPVFRLRPPSKGFERQGIKKPYTLGGALGDRKENINPILERMM